MPDTPWDLYAAPDKKPAFLDFLHSDWVNEQMNLLAPRERIAQLIHVASWSNRGEEHLQDRLRLIDQYGIGGVIFFQGDPLSQARMTNAYQAASKVPMLISIDAEWGLAMRLDDTIQYPYQMSMGALDDLSLIYAMGQQMAQQCRRLGLQVNFAPVVDINTEAKNPVIGFRAFGSDPEEVSKRAYAYMAGMQDGGVLAVAKHFPGHGDTDLDSHFDLPTLPHDEARMEAVELVPYRKLIQKGLGSVMTGHLQVPIWDERPLRGATLSAGITTEILIKRLGFEGLVFTDALDMKAAANHFPHGEVDAEALLAGNDVMLFTVDVAKALTSIEQAISEGRITQEEIDRRCRKLLALKQWTGLDQYAPIKLAGLVEELNTAESKALRARMAEEMISIPNGPSSLPAMHLQAATLSLLAAPIEGTELAHHQLNKGAASGATVELQLWQQLLSEKTAQNFTYQIQKGRLPDEAQLQQWAASPQLWIGLHRLHIKARHQFGFTPEIAEIISWLAQRTQVNLLLFSSPYVRDLMPTDLGVHTVIHAFQDSAFMHEAAARLLKGEITAKGRLPVKVKA